MSLLESVKKIVRDAASCMATDHFEILQKDGPENIVTSSDVAVQKYLCKELSQLIEGCGFFCEEEDRHECNAGYVWIIDPIDGTCNFARGIDNCAISVGLRKGDEIILGVVYSPAREEMYWAEKGCGAFCNGVPIKVSDRPFANALFCTAMSTYRKDLAGVCNDVIMEAYYKCNDVRRFGAASMEMCFMARGLIELYFEMRLQPWDYAAGILILQEAGGIMTNLDGEHPSWYQNDLVVAANSAESHAELLRIVRKHIPERPY